MFSRSRRRAVSRNLRDLERFHAECFYDAIAGNGFLEDLAEFAETRLAVFGGAANFAAEFADGKDNQRQENDGAERHPPVQCEHDGDEDNQRETFAEKVGEIFGKRDARAFDVVDGDGEQASGRMVLEEADRLPDDFGVNVVTQIGDGGVADVLDLRRAQIFGDAL